MGTYDTAVLQAELTRDEGEKLRPYMDTTGNMTIGIGRNLDAKGISHDEALVLFANDINDAERFLDRYLSWWRKLDVVRQRVMMNMAFNLQGKLLGFKKFLAAAQAGRWQEAHDEMLDSLWAGQVKDRATRLANMMLTGERA